MERSGILIDSSGLLAGENESNERVGRLPP